MVIKSTLLLACLWASNLTFDYVYCGVIIALDGRVEGQYNNELVVILLSLFDYIHCLSLKALHGRQYAT
jgi:hypothetical protein